MPRPRAKTTLRNLSGDGELYLMLQQRSGRVGEEHNRLVTRMLNNYRRQEQHADIRQDQRLVTKNQADVKACVEKAAALRQQKRAATDDDLKALEGKIMEADELVKSARARLKEAEKRAAIEREEIPYFGTIEMDEMRQRLTERASREGDLQTLAALAFGEGAGPERFTLVESNRRPTLVSRFQDAHIPALIPCHMTFYLPRLMRH